MAESNRSAMPPAVPVEVSIMSEGGRWVFRSDDAVPFYVFDKDPKGRSSCEDACVATWKPVIARPDAKPLGDWTFAARKDGSRQWAYKGRPIYTYAADEPGKAKGEGVDGAWHELKP